MLPYCNIAKTILVTFDRKFQYVYYSEHIIQIDMHR